MDRLYLNGYIGPLATSGGLVTFMREQWGKPIPSPVVLGQITEKFRESVKALAEREKIPIYQFDHKERKDDIANRVPATTRYPRRHRLHRCGAGEVTGVPRQEGRWLFPVHPR